MQTPPLNPYLHVSPAKSLERYEVENVEVKTIVSTDDDGEVCLKISLPSFSLIQAI